MKLDENKGVIVGINISKKRAGVVKILFVDDSCQKNNQYFGYGGYCIDEKYVNELTKDIYEIKRQFNIPFDIEIKWSPDKNHYFNKYITSGRKELFNKMIGLLHKYKAVIISTAFNLNKVYGRERHGWDFDKTKRWAMKEGTEYLLERFEKPFLENECDNGLIVIDSDNFKKIEDIFKIIQSIIQTGTKYQRFEKVRLCPMVGISEYCPPLQLADLVIGIITGCLSNNKYALELFGEIWPLFLKSMHKKEGVYESIYSASIIGYGFKLVPKDFKDIGIKLFDDIDEKYMFTNKGIVERKK